MSNNKVLLMILDGWGNGRHDKADVISTVHPEYISAMTEKYPHAELRTDGENVGLPDGQMGNSEVGHLNIGAGRVVYQDLVKINRACRDNSILENPEVKAAFEHAKKNGVNMHFMGLVSDGGVHSSLEHLFKLCDIAAEYKIENTFVHCFMDGRDTDPRSGKGFVADLEKHMAASTGKVATVIGRYYAMDRDKRWDRVEAAYDAMVYGEGAAVNPVPVAAVKDAYASGVTDEFVEPVVCDPEGTISDNDSVIFFNYRPDRAREITRTLVDPEFDGFTRQYFPVHFVCTTEYDAAMPNVTVAFPRLVVRNGLGEYLSTLGMTQLRIAETEKYAHVTFFFNGGENAPFPGEDDVCVPSPKGIDFDQQPELSLPAVADQVMGALGKYDFVVTNFANGDVIGHTLNTAAKLEACKHVSHYLDVVVHDALAKGYVVAVTADHGNIEKLYTAAGKPDGAHTTNLVPFILMDPAHSGPISLRDGCLGDVAPTVLNVMGIPQPAEMTGRSLAEGHDCVN